MRTFFGFMNKTDRFFLFLAFLFSLIQVRLNLLIPELMGEITTLLNTGSATQSDINAAGIRMVCFSVLSLLSSIVVVYLAAKISASFSMGLRNALFRKIMSFSPEETGAFSTSSLITRCTGDVILIEKLISAGVQIVFYAPMMAAVTVFRMRNARPVWVLTTVITLALMLCGLFLLLQLSKPHIIQTQKKKDVLNRVSREHIEGIKVIHGFNAYEFQKKRMGKANEELNNSVLRVNRINAALMPFGNGMSNLLGVLIYVIGAFVIRQAGQGEKIGLFSDMVVFSTYAALATAAFMLIVMIYIVGFSALASIRRVREVLNEEIKIRDPASPKILERGGGTVEFRGVSFRYPGSPGDTLSDLTFRVDSGQTVAIIGATGCGKTSLVNMIPRLTEATSGEVLVDGINVRDYKLSDLRGRIGYVPQRSILFSGTIAENIDYGDDGGFKKTLSHIKRAAEIGQAKEFIEKKEGAYQARVEQGGANFSGGQRQRLTITRAISREPEIYLFDDSFSALDYKTDQTLRQALKEEAKGATVIMVAQRISTIRDADKILVMDEGRLVGEGRHEELMDSCRVYREIALSQLPKEEMN